MSSLVGGLSLLVWLAIVLAIVVSLVRRQHTAAGDSWTLALPSPSMLAEVFFLVAVCFTGFALLGFNRDFELQLDRHDVVLIASLVAVVTAYLVEVGWPLLIGILGISGWWASKAQRWIQEGHVSPVTLIAGLGVLALLLVTLGSLEGRTTGARSRAAAYTVTGFVGVIGITFVLSTTKGLMELERGLRGNPPWTSPPLMISLAIIAGGFALVLLLAAGTRTLGGLEALAILLHGAFFAALVVAPEEPLIVATPARRMWMPAGPDFTDLGMAAAAGFNVLLFLQLVGVMVIGHTRRQAWLVNFGALCLLVTVVAKYFDWFFAFMNKSLFFLGAGVILLVVGWLLETSRRRMVARLRR